MRNVKLKIEYEGTCYHGWQRQNNVLTVQEVLEDRLSKIMKEKIKVNGCGRTDAGVHALEYVCNFFTSNIIPEEKIPIAANSLLPDDIKVLYAENVEENFHSRANALGKTYEYVIVNNDFMSVFKRNFAYRCPYKLDIDLMKNGAEYFLGEHDFKSFMSSGSKIIDTVRNINDLRLDKYGDEIVISISADGFLYNMVRIIVGTLLYVGKKKINAGDIPNIIETRDRQKAGVTVPPQGLYLKKVYY